MEYFLIKISLICKTMRIQSKYLILLDRFVISNTSCLFCWKFLGTKKSYYTESCRRVSLPFITECQGHVDSTPASYSKVGSSARKTTALRVFRVFLSSSRRTQGLCLKLGHHRFLRILPNLLFVIH